MPRYNYIAKSSPQKTIQASIDAESEQDAINKIIKMGYFPISVKSEIISFGPQVWRFSRRSKKELVLFTRQFASLIDSGVNIINALNIILSQTANKYLKSILSDIMSKIKDGKSLSDSLSLHPYLFSALYSAMIRTGEASGDLNNTLIRLADFMEKEEEFKNSVRASLSYPVFVFCVGVLTVLALLIFVIPRLVGMFEDMGQALPLPTKILINTSGFLRYYGGVILIVCILVIFFLRRFIQNPAGKIVWDRFKLKLLIFGPIILKNEISRFTRTLSLLLSSGVPITPSLEISMSVVDNQILRTEVQSFKEQITQGVSLSAVFKSSKIFPDFVTSIVAIGEETGNLDKSLLRIANDYERDVDRALKALARMIEPVIILVVGVVVGFIVLSMLLPIFQINLMVR